MSPTRSSANALVNGVAFSGAGDTMTMSSVNPAGSGPATGWGLAIGGVLESMLLAYGDEAPGQVQLSTLLRRSAR
jgi:hypothetical protein